MKCAQRLALVAIALGVGAGCTKADTPATSPESNAVPLVDLRKARAGSPERAVLAFIRYLQLGVVPLGVQKYDARVLQLLGVSTISGALESQRASLAASHISNSRAERTGLGSLVAIRVRPEDGADERFSFLLRRRGQGWRIIYDSLLAGAIAFYVQQQVQQSSGKAKPTSKAIQAGRRAANRYAALFTEPPGPSLPGARRTPSRP